MFKSLKIQCLTISLLISGTTCLTTNISLTKKSTSLDVLKTLKESKKLAPSIQTPGGATAFVTGGNSGIGLNCVETLALAGFNVILAARDVEKAQSIVDSSYFKDQIKVQELDLADLDSVKKCADEVEGNIDILLNNAGVMALNQRTLSKQGFELQLGVNHIGHHMLTRLLLPKMNAGGRIVTVASEAHKMTQSINFDDLNFEKDTYTPWVAYGQSKLANILFAKGLNDRLQGTDSDILSVCLHPGVINTQLWRHQPFLNIFGGVFSDKTIEQGAATSILCCLVESGELKGGEYVTDCKVSLPNKNGQDSDGKLRNKLWERTEKMISEAGYVLPEKII